MMTATEFLDRVGTLTPPTTSDGTVGLLAPMMRAMGHLLFALAGASASPPLLTEEELAKEVLEANNHLNSTITVRARCLSAEAITFLTNYRDLHTVAAANWDTWASEDRTRCLVNLINFSVAFATFLDRDIAGIPYYEANSGTAL